MHSVKKLNMPTEGFKACPNCAEEIRLGAVACRFCGHRMDGAQSRTFQPDWLGWLVALILIVLVMAMVVLPALRDYRRDQEREAQRIEDTLYAPP